MVLDPKAIAAILGALAIGAGAATGFLKITTPEAIACGAELTGVRVDLADKAARLELTSKAMTACEVALNTCAGVVP